MTGETMWQEAIWDSPLADEFLRKFGGKFKIHPTDELLFYEIGTWEDSKAFTMPHSEAEFWDVVSRSVGEGKNLLLSLPPFSSKS